MAFAFAGTAADFAGAWLGDKWHANSHQPCVNPVAFAFALGTGETSAWETETTSTLYY